MFCYITYYFLCYCKVKTTSLRHPIRGDGLKDYPAPAYTVRLDNPEVGL